MGMISKNSVWNNSLLRRNVGEKIVDRELSKRFYLYSPNFPGSHPLDRIAIAKKGNYFENKCFLYDVKTKPRRLNYPDTGIDFQHYNKYKQISELNKLDFFLFFVDEYVKEIYGNYIKKLSEPFTFTYKNKKLDYPLIDSGIIYFSLKKMVKLFPLKDDILYFEKLYSDRNYDYSKQEKDVM